MSLLAVAIVQSSEQGSVERKDDNIVVFSHKSQMSYAEVEHVLEIMM